MDLNLERYLIVSFLRDVFASHLMENFNFAEILWKLVVQLFLGIDRSSSRAVAEMSRTDRRLVLLQKRSRHDRRLVR